MASTQFIVGLRESMMLFLPTLFHPQWSFKNSSSPQSFKPPTCSLTLILSITYFTKQVGDLCQELLHFPTTKCKILLLLQVPVPPAFFSYSRGAMWLPAWGQFSLVTLGIYSHCFQHFTLFSLFCHINLTPLFNELLPLILKYIQALLLVQEKFLVLMSSSSHCRILLLPFSSWGLVIPMSCISLHPTSSFTGSYKFVIS